MIKSRGGLFLSIFFILYFSVPAFSKNPISSYFSGFLDETKAEIAIGKILFDGLVEQSGGLSKFASYPDLDKLASDIGKKASRNLAYKVLVIENPVPKEIPFPGGLILITQGMKGLLQTDLEREFIIGRNVAHISLRHPMNVLKREGLYAKLLRVLKKPSAKVDPEQIKKIVRDYIGALPRMDQLKADKEAVVLSSNPPALGKAAIQLLKRCSETLWPAMPWDWNDIPARIQSLENLQLH